MLNSEAISMSDEREHEEGDDKRLEKIKSLMRIWLSDGFTVLRERDAAREAY